MSAEERKNQGAKVRAVWGKRKARSVKRMAVNQGTVWRSRKGISYIRGRKAG
jgi:hypothetical protein